MPKFKLRAKVEKLDDVAEPYRGAYIEKDGGFIIDPEKLEAIEFDDKAELAGALKKERTTASTATAELKKFERFKALLEEEDEADSFLEAWAKRHEQGNGDGQGKPDPEKDKTALELKLAQKELKKAQDQVTTLTAAQEKADRELKEFRLWTPLRDIATKAGLEDWDIARLDLASKNQFGFDDDGKVVVLEDGQPSTITPEKFFKEVYTDQRPKFYKASGAAGSGSNGGGNGGTGKKIVTRKDFDVLSPVEQAAMADKASKGEIQITD